MKTSFFGWAMGIVAVSALVACGDDTTAGTGGAGGEGQGGATTATTTTGGNTTTSSTGGEGGSTTTTTTGGGGEGGEGGGEPQCTAITLADLAGSPGGQGQGVVAGTVDPNIGEDLVDNGFIEFWQDDTFNGAEPGTYDLSEEADYATCSRCILVVQDPSEEDGTPAKIFFQSEGTLELAEEGNVITAGFGTVTLTDVTLVEVTFGEDGMAIVDGGECLTIDSLEYDNPKIIPETWTCDPAFYEAADGCDCACGAYDPDCDAPATVYNCADPALPYCDATGACAAAPSWWECDAAEINDGETCNCMCGGPDPDCDSALDLPVDGCANVNQTCSADGTMCLNPESVCNDFTDNDNDGSFDCADASSCQGTPACTPGLTAQNGACDASNDCLALLDPLCITDENLGVNFGFCSQWCNLEADDCGGNEFCLDIGIEEGVCLTTCTEGGDECPAEFDCAEVAEAVFGCVPGVPEGWTCNPGFYNGGPTDGCDCGCGVVDLDCADANETSCEFCSAESCGNDGTEFGCDLAEINDANNAVCN